MAGTRDEGTMLKASTEHFTEMRTDAMKNLFWKIILVGVLLVTSLGIIVLFIADNR